LNEKALKREMMTRAGIAIAMVAFLGIPLTAKADVIGFDDYASAQDNQLTQDFVQGPAEYSSPLPLYVESPSGGVSGGAMLGYSGQDYFATAVYANQTFGHIE
jgi:hypothetical protein